MIYYESTSSSIIGNPQIEKINQLQLNQLYTPLGNRIVTIDGVISGTETPNDHTLPTEAYVKTYVENNITAIQNNDLSDIVSFLQIVSAPFNGSEYHNFIEKTEQKTITLDFINEPLRYYNKGEIQTCQTKLTLVVPNSYFASPLYAKFNYNVNDINSYNKCPTLVDSVLASQSGWVSSTASGTPTFIGDYCVAFPSNKLSTDIEYTFVSYVNGMLFFNDQFFDTPRGQFINLNTGSRTSGKPVPTGVCSAYKLVYLFVTYTNGIWALETTNLKPKITNRETGLTLVDNTWYFNNMKQCWFSCSNGGIRERNACFVGVLAVGPNDLVAAWNMPPAQLVNPYNTVRLDQTDETTINTLSEINTVNIFNKKVTVVSDLIRPEINLLSKCCQYYIYVDRFGNYQFDWKRPYENAFGEYYHLTNYWKCVGEFFVNHNNTINNVLDLHDSIRYDDKGESRTLVYEFPQAHLFANPYNEYTNTAVYPCCRHFFAPLNKKFSRNLSYYNITFASAGGNGHRPDISDAKTFATITTSYNDLLMCLEDGRRGNISQAGSNNYGRSGGTRVGAAIAVSSTGVHSTASSYIDVNNYAKGGNSSTGYGGNSGNVCVDKVIVAKLPECFVNFGATQALTGNTLGYAKFELKFYKDN